MIRQRHAREAWCYLEEEFLGQKESRALLLETQFRNLRQDSMNVTDYCRKLETMATSLAEFGDPIGDRQMVLTLLRGLNGKLRHMVSILKMHRPFPSFAEARTHLLLEEIDLDAALLAPLLSLPPPTAPPDSPPPLHPSGRARQPGRQRAKVAAGKAARWSRRADKSTAPSP